MQIRCDWHVHTHNSPCGKDEATVERLAECIRAAGIERWGIADHIFTEENIADLEAARAEYDALESRNGIEFAVEASVLRDWDIERTRAEGNIWGRFPGGPQGRLELILPEELVERLGIRYVIAGSHWPLGARMKADSCVRSYHRQNMFLAEHPQVDIIAHPWWWRTTFHKANGEVAPFRWLDDFSIIPQSMHDEFAAAARENGKAVEINASITFSDGYGQRWRRQYDEYLIFLRESGCMFSTGSDSHEADYKRWPEGFSDHLSSLGFTEEHFWPGPEA
ncbi:MAG: hypothetical protein GWP05_04845 [Anaerolineaceae bacterium]|nr:hypothetical protein [Anaerolineaceae bacterium]